MCKFTKSILVLMLMMLLSGPVHAGISDFFKGDWGMSPDEITALAGQPVKTLQGGADDVYGATLEYAPQILGETAALQYFFNKQDQLVHVTVIFEYIDEQVSPARFGNLIARLKASVADDASPYATVTEIETARGPDLEYSRDTQSWLNSQNHVIMALQTELKPLAAGGTYEAAHIVMEFNTVPHADVYALEEINKFKTRFAANNKLE